MAPHRSFIAWLDSLESIVSALYLMVTMVIGGAAVGVLVYIGRKEPPKFGTQGEWFWLGIAALFVLGWALGHIVSLIQRLRRPPARDTQSTSRRIELSPKGLSFEWNPSGRPPSTPRQNDSWTWNFESSPMQTTFRLDHEQLATARTLRDSGLPWDVIARRVNAEHDSLTAIEQMLYQRALERAVNTPAPEQSEQS